MKYIEKIRSRTTEYTLKESSIVVNQKEKFGVDINDEIQLKSLSLPHGTIYKKSEYYFLPVASIGVIIFLISLLSLGTPDGILNSKFLILTSITIVTFIVSACSGKKQKMVFYSNEENLYIFGIRRVKQVDTEYDKFIEKIDTKISELKK